MSLLDRLIKRHRVKSPPRPPREVEQARERLVELELRLASATIDQNGRGNAGRQRR